MSKREMPGIDSDSTGTKEYSEQRAKTVMNNLGLSLDEMRGKKILDLGAGLAELAQYAKEHGINIISLDIDPGFAAGIEGKNIPKGIDYVQSKTDALPFPAGSLDLVLSHGAPPGNTQNREEVIRIIREVENLLKEGGEFRFGPGHLHPEILDEEELFSKEEEASFSNEERRERIREKSLAFLKSLDENILEVPIKGKENDIGGFFYLMPKGRK